MERGRRAGMARRSNSGSAAKSTICQPSERCSFHWRLGTFALLLVAAACSVAASESVGWRTDAADFLTLRTSSTVRQRS